MTPLLSTGVRQTSKKYIVLLSDTAVILFRAGSRMGVKYRYVKFTVPVGTYRINEFNTKIKAAEIKTSQTRTLHIYVR